ASEQLCQGRSARTLGRCLIVIEMQPGIKRSIFTVEQIFEASQRILMSRTISSFHQLPIVFLKRYLDGSRAEIFKCGLVVPGCFPPLRGFGPCAWESFLCKRPARRCGPETSQACRDSPWLLSRALRFVSRRL